MSSVVAKRVDFETMHKQFPIFQQQSGAHPLVYLDSAATTQKPQRVIDAVSHYYQSSNANVHRAVYKLCEKATVQYEAARQSVRRFINAGRNHEIVFTRSATEAINLLAHSFGELEINEGDEIILSMMEHHSNIVPWQTLCQKKKACLKVIPITDAGELDLEAYKTLLSAKTKLVAVIHASNVLGTINPVKEIIVEAKKHAVPVMLDGTQAVPHIPVDVTDLDCDFYVFSGHKMYGPTGVGVLYAKEAWLEKMPPYQTGGDMIKKVTFEETTFNVLPHKFEAGTPNMAGVIGLGEAVNFLQELSMERIFAHECELLDYATARLSEFERLRIIGTAKHKVGVVSFVMDGAHPHDIATILDQQGVAIRAGNHCTMPLMQNYKLAATARASFGVYTTKEDIDALVAGLTAVCDIFQ